MVSTGIFSQAAQQQLFDKEDRHFWFKSRAAFIIARLKKLGLLKKSLKAAEIGCGNGYTSSKLIHHLGHYYASEGSQEALMHMQARLDALTIDKSLYSLECINLVRDKLQNKYDLILAFDVIEHIEPKELEKLLVKLRGSLNDNGSLVVTVPAFMWLWTIIDRDAGHYQRFTNSSLTGLMNRCGYKTIYSSYFFLAVLPFYIAQRYLLKLQHGEKAVESHLEINPIINLILYSLTLLDSILIRVLGTLPIGSSLFLVARK